MDVIKPTEKKLPNIRLQHERKLKGWSQNYVAKKIGTTAKNVSRWERGDKPVPYYRAKLCTLFGKNAAQLGFLDDGALDENSPQETNSKATDISPPENSAAQLDIPNASSPPKQIQLLIPGSPPVYVTIQMREQTLAQDGILSVRESLPQAEGEDDMDRRDALKAMGVAGVTLLASHFNSLDQGALERLSALMTKPSHIIDMRSVNSLGKITESHWELVYGGVPKRDLLYSVEGHLQSVAHFLRNSPSTTIEQHLCVIASQQTQIMSEIYFDMHDYAKAETYSKLAIEMAQRADNPALYAVALARMSFLYTYSRRFKEALSFLQAARRHAEQSTEITISCWIAAMEAEVQANIFAYYHDIKASGACLRALDRAERINEIGQTEKDVFWTKFGSASLAGYKGVCFKQLPKKL